MPTTTIKKTSEEGELRLVFGEVYAPNRPDVHGEFMDAETIRVMAHDFMRKKMQGAVDVQHNNETVPQVVIVESFIAREGDPDFIADAWVVGCHVNDDDLWEKIKNGELNGFSVEAEVHKEVTEVTLEIPPEVTGTTSEVEEHTHKFSVLYKEDGTFLGGRTTLDRGHLHTIAAGTITEVAQGHRHRFSSVDNLKIVEQETED